MATIIQEIIPWATLLGVMLFVGVGAGLTAFYLGFKTPGMVIERRGDGINHWRKIRTRKIEKDGVTKYLLFKWSVLGDQLGFTNGNRIYIKPPAKSNSMHGMGGSDFIVLAKNLDGTYCHVPYNYSQNAFENIPAEVLYWSNIARKESAQLFKSGPNWTALGSFAIVTFGLIVCLLMVLFTLDSIEGLRGGAVAGTSLVNSSLLRSVTGG